LQDKEKEEGYWMKQQDQTIGIVWIHGAGLQSKIWEKAAKQLNYPTLSVSFPIENRKQMRLKDYSSYIQQRLNTWEVEKFVIVAHSIGGIIGLELASMFPDRLVGFVAVGAAIPREGESFLSLFPYAKRHMMRLLLHVFGTKPPETAIRKGLCNDLTRDQADEVVHSFVPESIYLYTDLLRVSVPNVEKLYVKLSDDQEFLPSFQDQMIGHLDPQRIESIDTGHLPMISNPQQFSLILHDFIKDIRIRAI
jgi:pimeloyl-ACP methyl ester carboxylesterase